MGVENKRRHFDSEYAPITHPEIIRTNMLDAINKEIQLFIIALDRTKKDLKADGSEDKYLLERIASLKRSHENGKNAIDILESNT